MTESNTTPYGIVKTFVKLVLHRGVRTFYSQSGEDAIVQAALKQKDGIYIDVGAYHPILYSNTYAFYKRGWRGIAIDPNPRFERLFRALRSRDTFVCTGIGEQEGTLTYYKFNDAAYNTFDVPSMEEYKSLRWLKLLGTEQVSIRPLSQILKEQNISKIDFLNVDVEGKDLEVLRSHDWSIPTKVIAVEDRNFNASEPASSPTFSFLKEKGYTLTGLTRDSLIFTKK